ncbi:hypothetical protein [Sphingomonas sp. HMP6]|uniref:hypothetical protein n=1 Tax=Sphingomonas sp. HMP6 TaxID=1517551 RepID=UPI00159682B8|nr:hypothetical protein [Sphingomonas sp. HMP6]BCA60718.1 hypothetical protein HMP06_3487 [Sphingomonas sp. HMP6]
MKFSRVTAAIVMASLSAPLFAASEQSVGTLTAVSQGTVVARDGKLLPARAGQSLFVGDRVITRGSSAKVAMQGCNVALKPTSILSVGTAGCAAPQSFAATQDDTSGAGEGTGGSSTGYIIGGLALVAVAGGIVAATSNTSTKAVSP